MRVVRLCRFFAGERLERPREFSICHDAMLCGDIALAQQFAGYSLVVPFLLHIIIGVLPDFSVIGLLLQFYIVYVVWEGTSTLMKVGEKDRLRFTILSSVLLIVCPSSIQWIFNKLTIALN